MTGSIITGTEKSTGMKSGKYDGLQGMSGRSAEAAKTGGKRMQGTIVGVSGGDLGSTASLNEYAVCLTGKAHPQVLFIPTASEDAEGYMDNIKKYYGAMGCTVSTLCIVARTCSQQEMEALFRDADLIYVGGGDTEAMLQRWQEQGVDKLMQKAYQDGRVLTGISAGMIIWFACGFSDSDYFKNPEDWDYKFIKGMGNFPYVVCPHYNEEGRSRFDDRLAETGMDGIALENDTAIVVQNGKLFVKKAREDAKAFLLKREESGYRKVELRENEEIR